MQKSRLKLGIIGSVGVPANYGGFETLVHYLVLNLNKRFDLTVCCSLPAYKEEDRCDTWEGAKLKYIPLKANGLQSILYDLWSMIYVLRNCDMMLVLGVSGCMFLPFLKLFTKKKIAVNIDGLEWRRPKWNSLVKRFLLFSEKMACRFADEVVTDNRILKEYVQIRYGIKGNLVEYGADHVRKVPIRGKDLRTFSFLKGDYAFKVARIEPENHIHLILEAFSQLPKQEFALMGNWDNSDYGKDLRKKYEKCSNLHMLDPSYDSNRLDLLRSNCKFYVHGHSAGGTNPALVEAMFLQLPVVAYDVIYNRVTANNQAIFFNDVAELKQIISSIDKYPLFSIARDMKAYADRRYTWKNVSWRYGNLMEGFERVEVPAFSMNSATAELAETAKNQPKTEPVIAVKRVAKQKTEKIKVYQER